MNIRYSFLMIFSLLQGNQDREFFLKAQTFYKEGRLEEALDAYIALQNKNSAVWYNMGLCYDAIHEDSKALLAFCQAQKHADYMLLKKIEPRIKALQDRLHVARNSFRYSLLLTIKSLISSLLVQLLFLLFFGIFIFLIWFKRLRGLFGIFVFCGLLVTGMLVGVHYWFASQQYALVMQEKIMLFSGPNKEFHQVADILCGNQVKVVEQDRSWYKVDFHGVQGWAEKSGLELII